PETIVRTDLARFRVIAGQLPLSCVLLEDIGNREGLLDSGHVLNGNGILSRRQTGNHKGGVLRRIECAAKEFRTLVGLRSWSVEQPFVADLRLSPGDFVFVALDRTGDSLEIIGD